MKLLIISGLLGIMFLGLFCSPGSVKGATLSAQPAPGRVLSSIKVKATQVYRLSFPLQTMRMGYSRQSHLLFLTLLKDNRVLVVDSRTGMVIKTISDVPRPLDVTFDWKKRNILVTEADSRIFHLIPLDNPRKMTDLPTGLNPTVIEYRGPLGTFLLAAAVHILYRLDSDTYQVDRWTAFGDRIHEITFRDDGLYIPLLRHSRILVVNGKTLQVVHDERLDLCERLTTLLPLPDGGIAALCENELLVRRTAGGAFHHRYSDDSPGTMVGPVKGKDLLIFYPDAQEMVVTDLVTLRPAQRISLDGRPMWSKLTHDGSGVFVITSNPSDNRVRLERFALEPVYAPAPHALIPVSAAKGSSPAPVSIPVLGKAGENPKGKGAPPLSSQSVPAVKNVGNAPVSNQNPHSSVPVPEKKHS